MGNVHIQEGNICWEMKENYSGIKALTECSRLKNRFEAQEEYTETSNDVVLLQNRHNSNKRAGKMTHLISISILHLKKKAEKMYDVLLCLMEKYFPLQQ